MFQLWDDFPGLPWRMRQVHFKNGTYFERSFLTEYIHLIDCVRYLKVYYNPYTIYSNTSVINITNIQLVAEIKTILRDGMSIKTITDTRHGYVAGEPIIYPNASIFNATFDPVMLPETTVNSASAIYGSFFVIFASYLVLFN